MDGCPSGSKDLDCKSSGNCLRRFESSPIHHLKRIDMIRTINNITFPTVLITRVNSCDILSFFDEHRECSELPDIMWTQLSTGPVGHIQNMQRLGIKIEGSKRKYIRPRRW